MSEPPSSSQSNSLSGNLTGSTPLVGQTIVVTRAAEQARLTCEALVKMGAHEISHPVIRICPPEDPADVDRVIHAIDDYDGLVFVSANAVRFFLEPFVLLHGSTAILKSKTIAAIGMSTSKQLQLMGDLVVDLVPPHSNSESLGLTLKEYVSGKKLLIPRADQRTKILTEILSEASICFEEVVVYRSADVTSVDPEVASRMAQGRIDWVTVTSGAIARSLARLFGDQLLKTKLVSISPGTSSVLREQGYLPTAEASSYDMQGIVDAIVQYSTGKD